MRYTNTSRATFLSRPNRFIATVELGGAVETVHVKNTGRCKELLLPGTPVVLTRPGTPNRKTEYDLIAVERDGQWINIDSQAPNKAAAEYLRRRYPEACIRPEYRQGDSRLDFLLEFPNTKRLFMEVKGVTLLVGDVALFPDAPTERGVKHLEELSACAAAGDKACMLFLLQMRRARCLRPNEETHPAFGEALRKAKKSGVTILALDCDVTESTMTVHGPVPVEL